MELINVKKQKIQYVHIFVFNVLKFL